MVDGRLLHVRRPFPVSYTHLDVYKRQDSGVALTSLKVDGGMVFNDTLMQFQSDVLGVPVVRPTVAETTSLGAAYAAGLAVGFWAQVEDLRENWGLSLIHI